MIAPMTQHLRCHLTRAQGHAEIRNFRHLIAGLRSDPRFSARLQAHHYEGWLRAYLKAFGDPDEIRPDADAPLDEQTRADRWG